MVMLEEAVTVDEEYNKLNAYEREEGPDKLGRIMLAR